MKKLCFLTLCFIAVRASSASGQDILYNQKYSIACHNCYEKKYSCDLNDILKYTSTLEFDIWDSRILFSRKKLSGTDWYVKHNFLQRGNKNCFDASFKQWLIEIERWSNENPNHDPITVFIDKKEGWRKGKSGRKPNDLDSLITSILPERKIFMPKALLNSIDLKSSIRNESWPPVSSLKGKIIFVLTDASIFTHRNNILDDYLDNRQQSAVCFVAPLIKKEKEISRPKGLSEKNAANVVFYNLKYKNSKLSTEINCCNYINRVYKSPETVKSVNALTDGKVNFIALYNYKISR